MLALKYSKQKYVVIVKFIVKLKLHPIFSIPIAKHIQPNNFTAGVSNAALEGDYFPSAAAKNYLNLI